MKFMMPKVLFPLITQLVLIFSVSLVVDGTVQHAGPPKWNELDESYAFEKYLVDFGKYYTTKEEYSHRRVIFERNIKKILEHNSIIKKSNQNQRGHVLGVNHLTDVDVGELPLGYDKSLNTAWKAMLENPKSTIIDERKEESTDLPLPFPVLDPSSLPKAVDWRTKSVVTAIKSQGHCGSCWAFAAAAVLESHLAIKTGKLFDLSPQELVSCVPNPRECGGDGGCSGSTAEIAFDFVKDHGIVDEWTFGYQSYDGKKVNCTLKGKGNDVDIIVPTATAIRDERRSLRLKNHLNRDDAKILSSRSSQSTYLLSQRDHPKKYIAGAKGAIEGYINIQSNNYTALMNAVAHYGPVVVNVAANAWGLYERGVFTDQTNHSALMTDLNHAVVLDGYGTDKETGEDYWLIRNSWGPMWGEDGYIRLKRVDPTTSEENDCGMDISPADGTACTKKDDGSKVIPPPVKVCGTCGILFDPVVPIGGHLV